MNPEKQPINESGSAELQKTAEAASERLAARQEKAAELSPEKKHERVEKARHEAKEVLSKEAGKESARAPEPTARAVHRVTSSQKKTTYKHTMKQIQSEMNPISRSFSKIIHNPIVEKTSDTVGGSVARPNAILAGSFSAFVLVTAVYLVARHYGYPLSGFETIAAFLFGWALGLIYDYLRVMALGRRS